MSLPQHARLARNLVAEALGLSPRLRVFQIGFNRCATMSLARFYRRNGYRAVHWRNGQVAAAIELARLEGKPLLEYVGDHHIYTDMECRGLATLRRDPGAAKVFERLFALRPGDEPIYAYKYFVDLDRQYPGSKFILNTRSLESWVQSRLRFKHDYRACLHGDDAHQDEASLIACWKDDREGHHADVLAYFADRPDDLLVFDIERGSIDSLIEFVAPHRLNRNHWLQDNASGR